MNLDPKLKEILDSLDPSAVEPVEEMTPQKARRTWKAEMAALAGGPLAAPLSSPISIWRSIAA